MEKNYNYLFKKNKKKHTPALTLSLPGPYGPIAQLPAGQVFPPSAISSWSLK